jgi:polysaccharide export outer membrane protein
MIMRPAHTLVVLEAALTLFGPLGLTEGLTACGPSVYERYAYNKEWDPRKHEYIIGVADTVAISVYHAPEMSGAGAVRPDGVLTLPILGDLAVAGKTPSQVREEVKKKLAVFVKADTVVNVTVTGFSSYRFIVSGNVGHSASFQAPYYVTVSEAIAMAGGPTKFADDQILVLRADHEGHVREIPVSYKAITSGRHPEQDICITSGDSIVVQ